MRDALLRREGAAALTWADIAAEADGSGRLTVRRSKTDPAAQGAVMSLGPQALRDIAAIRPLRADSARSVFGLGGARISRRIAEVARAAGPGSGCSGHSPCVGMAQDLSAAGIDLPALMQAGRWK